MPISRKLRAAVKLSPVRMYRLAQEAGLHPSTLSKLINGITPARPGDPRILRLGTLLGLKPEELFEEAEPETAPGNLPPHSAENQ